MPLNVKPGDITGVSTNLNVDLTPGVQPVGLTDQLLSAMALDNLPFSAVVRATDEAIQAASTPSGPRPPFDVLSVLTESERFHASDFADVETPEGLSDVRRRRAREDEMRQNLGSGPLPEMLATTLAVLTDPTSYIPIVGALGKGGMATKLLRVGAISAAEVAAQEAGLQAVQETRTIEESLAAVMLGGAFGMTVGGAVAARSGGQAVARAIDARTLRRATDDAATVMRAEFPDSTAGAAQARRIDPEDTQLAGSLGAVNVARATLSKLRLAAPSLDVLASPFATARNTLLRLVDPGLVTKGNLRGVANPQAVEVKIKRHTAVFADANRVFNDLYKAHRTAGGTLSKTDFFEEVGKAMRRGDEHADPAIKKTAQETRKVFDAYKKQAEAARLLPEDVGVTTATSYLSRVYRRDRIKARSPEFRAIIVRWLQDAAPKEDTAMLGSVADDIINTILGSPDGRTAILGRIGGASPRARGPLKERTFNIPDALIEDFLESNVQVITNRYIRTMAADIEFAREFGEVDPTGALKAEIRDETTKLTNEAKTEKERVRLRNEGLRTEATIEEMVNQLRGVGGDMLNPNYAGYKSAFRSLRNLNFARLLGGVVISSIGDVGLIVMQEGLARTVGTVMREFGRGFKGVRMASAEAQTAGTALDMFLSTRVRHMLDLGERYEAQTGIEKFERGTQGLANLGAQVFMINHWNTALKSVTSMMAGTRILDTARKIARGEKLSKFEQRRLAQAGITPEIAGRMADQAKHWTEVGEGRGQVLIANADQWADRQAADFFLNALLRDVDNAIITPGVGDAPLWTTKEWGKSIFQFKKFSSATTQRILISGLQARDMAALNGLLAIVGLGAMGTALRDVVSGGEVRDRNPQQWAADAIDRSGALSMFYEMDAMMEKGLGVSPITAATGQQVSRFAGRDIASQALGPSVGLVVDAGVTANAALQGDFTQSDLHKIRRLVPMQNVFYARWMFDQMEQGIARAFNLPKKQPRRRAVAPPSFGE